MKLFEMKRRPRSAGTAKLEYAAGVSQPKRVGRQICLPENPELEYFPLQRGQQFLVRLNDSYREAQIWFGGTDEQPFLTRLKTETFMKFTHEGERGFFESLKPTLIINLSRQLRIPHVRQGDFFAVPLGVGWEELERAMMIVGGKKFLPKHSVASTKDAGIFRTRHHLTGQWTNEASVLGQNGLLLVSGKLEAPDHEPLKLSQPSVLAQAQYLWDPPNTD